MRLRALLVVLLSVLGLRRLRHPRSGGPAVLAGPDTVRADDGTPLHVEVDDLPGAAVTVVLVHGFTARLQEFALQRETLHGRCRVVLYDQRGHGRSGWGDGRHATIDQLGRDLSTVLDRYAPGPVVLLGHSMGGMTVMALARQRPELFGPRVKGVFLLATAASEVGSGGVVGLVARVGRRLGLLPLWLWWLRQTAPLLQRLQRRGSRLGNLFIRHYLFGRDDADPQTVRQVQDMLEQAPLTVSAAFYPSLLAHDEVAALPVLGSVPVTVLVGDSDRLTPAVHSERMVRGLGEGARLVVVPGAGHSVNITRRTVVDEALLQLLDRVAATAAA